MSRCSENAETTCKSYPNCDGCNAYGNKMLTDAEIIKALECCMNGNCDDNCPFRETKEHCHNLDSLILDLINRQKAEIEKQSQNFKVLVSDHRTLQQSFDNLKGLYEDEKSKAEKAKEKCIHFAKELQTAKAEIERLQNKVEELADVLSNSIRIRYAEAKAEAIKEFAERVKTDVYDWIDDIGVNPRYAIATARIDNLVKEMVGE